MIIGYQDWRDLLFLHWRVPAAELAGLVHPRLSIDEREGSAWVSMTPFTLRNGRFRGLPALPDFHELNFPARMDRGEGWYRSERLLKRGRFEVRFSTGAERGCAAPGSLEEFLVERYRLYSRAAGPALWCGRVRHEPWPLFQATVTEVSEDLSIAAGVPALGRPHFGAWSPGVSVEFEPFRPA